MKKIFLLLICTVFVVSCGTKTTVILLPDEKPGAVVVKTDKDSVVIDKPYSSVSISDPSSKPSIKEMDKEKVDKKFNALFDSEPERPAHFILYFLENSTLMDEDSNARIPQILTEAKKREPSEISIIGHSDTKGSKEYNIKLSLERAKAVKKVLEGYDPGIKQIVIQSFGEQELLIPTEDDVSEWRNRRVEIMIR